MISKSYDETAHIVLENCQVLPYVDKNVLNILINYS